MKSKALALALVLLFSALAPTPPIAAGDLPSGKPAEVGLSAARLARIGEVMEAYVAEGRLAGASALVARHGKIVYFDAWGARDRESGAPVTRETIFRIFSMTKPVTSVAVMMLYEEGRFLLNDPISKFLPELAEPEVLVMMDVGAPAGRVPVRVPARREITIRDLLRHTSGYTYGIFDDTDVDRLYQEAELLDEKRPLSELVERLGELPLKHQPGTVWNYGVSTDVLGRLVEVVSGRALDAFFEARIFEPLEMPDTGFWVPPEDQDRLATLYVEGKPARGLYEATRRPARLSGGGGLVSTLDDYLRFCTMLLNRGELDGVRLLSPKTVDLMTADHLGGINHGSLGEGYGFGLGFAVAGAPGETGDLATEGTYYWGGIAGTGFFVDPAEALVGVFMTQHWLDLEPADRFKVLVYQAVVD